MFNAFTRFVTKNKLVAPGDRVLLAVSGGVDSMVMSHLFFQMNINLGIIHCNFSLRANESDKDEKMVRDYADKHNIPFYSKQFNTKSYAKENGLSVQMAARELRYSWFEEIRVKKGYDTIAVAHNLNDNVETLLINLIRGTGISGLTGMKPAINRIIRPLLFASREDIIVYCKQNYIAYREDMSNAETKYTRNKIRHLIIPLLKEINPSVEYTLNDTAERFIGITEIVSGYIAGLKERISKQEGELNIFNFSLLKEHLHNSTILYELFKPYGITNARLNDLIKVIDGKTGGQIFTDTHRIIKNRKEVIVSANDKVKDTSYKIADINDLRNVPGIVSAEYSDVASNFEIPSDHLIACIDSEKISFPLTIRKWKAGDQFCPLGMKQKKKLSDYFIDNRYSKITKENKYILESDGKIVWIVGDRIDNRFRITISTRKALIIETGVQIY